LARDQILGKVLSYRFVKRNATKRNKVRQQGKLLGSSHVYVLVGFHRTLQSLALMWNLI